jgi:hypothetical protein
MLIDKSYFVGDLDIPNTGDLPVSERLTWFIQKYEPDFLQKLLGYPLYKVFIAGLNVTAPAVPEQRFIDILYGKEYTDINGLLRKWKGLIVTDSPTLNLAGGYVYRKPEYITIGGTPGTVSGVNTLTFDGTNGSPDWRGWVPIIERIGFMKPDVDYSWNPTTGVLTLLKVNDVFGNLEYFFVQFELRNNSDVNSPTFTTNQSCIAQYIYYKYGCDAATQNTGIGQVITNAENAMNVSPRRKLATVWNATHYWCMGLVDFIEAMNQQTPAPYPEWQWDQRANVICEFGFCNPIF